MNDIRVVIIDDEPIAIEVIKELIAHLTTGLVVESTASNGIEAVEKIASLKPDLVFMDVDMPLMNGIEVLQKFPDRSFEIIFTTGFESYTLKKMKHEPVDYLLKPIDPDEFITAVQKVRNKMGITNDPA